MCLSKVDKLNPIVKCYLKLKLHLKAPDFYECSSKGFQYQNVCITRQDSHQNHFSFQINLDTATWHAITQEKMFDYSTHA